MPGQEEEDSVATQVEALDRAAGGKCAPCLDAPCLPQPCGYHCKYPYTDDSTMWAKNCPTCRDRREAAAQLANLAQPKDGQLGHLAVLTRALEWYQQFFGADAAAIYATEALDSLAAAMRLAEQKEMG